MGPSPRLPVWGLTPLVRLDVDSRAGALADGADLPAAASDLEATAVPDLLHQLLAPIHVATSFLIPRLSLPLTEGAIIDAPAKP